MLKPQLSAPPLLTNQNKQSNNLSGFVNGNLTNGNIMNRIPFNPQSMNQSHSRPVPIIPITGNPNNDKIHQYGEQDSVKDSVTHTTKTEPLLSLPFDQATPPQKRNNDLIHICQCITCGESFNRQDKKDENPFGGSRRIGGGGGNNTRSGSSLLKTITKQKIGTSSDRLKITIDKSISNGKIVFYLFTLYRRYTRIG